MSDDAGRGFRFRDTTRAPFETEVGLRFDRESGTLTAQSADISMEGMFIQTDEPRAIGTLVQFEFSHAGETVQGLGDVVWVRQEKQPPNKPRGMGIQFRYVDPHSRELIYRIVSDFLRRVSQDQAPTVETQDASEPAGTTASPASSESAAASETESSPASDETPSADPSLDATIHEDLGLLSPAAQAGGQPLAGEPLTLEGADASAPSPDQSAPEAPSVSIDEAANLESLGSALEPASQADPSAQVPLEGSLPSEQATVMVPNAGDLLAQLDPVTPSAPAPAETDAAAVALPTQDPDRTVLSPSGLESVELSSVEASAANALPELAAPEAPAQATVPPRTSSAGEPDSWQLPDAVPVEDPVHQNPLSSPAASSGSSGFGSASASTARRDVLRPLVLLLLLVALAGALYLNRARLFPQFFGADASRSTSQSDEPQVPGPSQPQDQGAAADIGEAGASSTDSETGDADADGGGRDGATDESATAAAQQGDQQASTPPTSAPGDSATEPDFGGGVSTEDTPSSAPIVGRITRTQVTERGSSTEVRISLDRNATTADLSVINLSGPPRFVVKIRGISVPYTFRESGARFERARTGLHETDGGPELHVVFDLSGESIEAAADVENGQVVVSLQDI